MGPSYTPWWFGHLTATNAGRIRVLRVIYSLINAELLTLGKSAGGRLERIHLTAKEHRAARSLENIKLRRSHSEPCRALVRYKSRSVPRLSAF